MPPRQQIPLQPRLTGVLGKYLKHAAAVRADVLGGTAGPDGPLIVSLGGRGEDAASLLLINSSGEKMRKLVGFPAISCAR